MIHISQHPGLDKEIWIVIARHEYEDHQNVHDCIDNATTIENMLVKHNYGHMKK
jgi:hypothetical protein